MSSKTGLVLWEDVPRGCLWADVNGHTFLRWPAPDEQGRDCGFHNRTYPHSRMNIAHHVLVEVIAADLTTEQCVALSEIYVNSERIAAAKQMRLDQTLRV